MTSKTAGKRIARELNLTLPHAPEAASLARQYTRTTFHTAITPEVLDDALLVVTELVTNAVRYALPPIRLRVSFSTRDSCALRIEVTDAGPAPRPQQESAVRPPEENGRGNEIVAALSTRHGTRPRATAVTRWAVLDQRSE